MKQTHQQLWGNCRYWKWHFIYRCAEDPRLVVPMRHRWLGYTLNFAHRSASRFAPCIVLAIIVPPMVSIRDGRHQDLPLSIGLSCLFAFLLVFIASRLGRD